jgi:putative Ca2+/H+ antiporter (TMEM165/GDT1 family)
MGDVWSALWISTGAVALGEIGDKTQLLALLLAARFRRPLPIITGILVATAANHALAGLTGAWVQSLVDPQWLRWGLALSFAAVGIWMLIPDSVDEPNAEAEAAKGAWGIFWVTTMAFFLAEMGDKTQIATVMLAARFDALIAVTVGTTLGMMLANVPAVLIGERAVNFVPLHWVHRASAALFIAMGVALALHTPVPGG